MQPSRKSKIALSALAGAAIALVIGTFALRSYLNSEDLKPRIEAAASRSLGMDVKVDGGLHVSVFPRLHVTLEKVHLTRRGSELLFADTAHLAIKLLPLLHKEVSYAGITLEGARITIERDKDGHYNYQKVPGQVGIFRGLELPRVSFPDLTFVYEDKKAGTGFEALGCKGELTDLSHPGNAPFLARLSASGHFDCGEVRGKTRAISDLKFVLEATGGIFEFKPVTMKLAGGQASGVLHMDRSVEVPVLQLQYAVEKFHLEQVLKSLPKGRSVTGLMDFSTSLTMHGKTRDELVKSAAGEASLSGTNLTLKGIDLDKAASAWEAVQEVSPFDLAAVLLAGPLGILVTKGYDVSQAAAQSTGDTQIRTVVSKWKVEKGVATAQDAALSTGKSRLALHGALDFVDHEYDEVYIAIVDANGCARLRQRVRGPFKQPVVEKPSLLDAVAGSVSNLVGKAAELLPGGKAGCEVFYSGTVAAPQ